MRMIEVTDERDLRRARHAQYSGIDKTITLASETVTGRVVSVSRVDNTRWQIKVRPTPAREQVKVLRLL